MARQVLDGSIELRSSSAASVTASGNNPGVAVACGRLPTCSWQLHVASLLATGTYLFVLEASTTSTGPWVEVARLPWPAGNAPGVVQMPVSGQALAVLVPQAAWLRVSHTLGGTPSIVYSSTLTTCVTRVGDARRATDLASVV